MADMGSGEANIQQQLYERKRKINEMVKIRFARYGEEVLSIILGYALQPARMPVLLDRLEVRTAGRSLEYQLDAISSYLAQNGAIRFVSRAMNLQNQQVKPIDLDKFEHDVEMVTGQNSADRLEVLTGAPPPPPPQARSILDQPPPPRPVAPPPPPPAPKPINEAGPWVRTPSYTGPDRRVTHERRQSASRRREMSAIRSNKRFGGERRKVLRGRRKDDQARPEKWWQWLGTPEQDMRLPFLKKRPR